MATTSVTSGMNPTNITIAAGSGYDVQNGGTITSATLQAGSVATNSAGAMPVLSGAASGTASAGLIIENGGADVGTTIQAGAVELVLASGTATGDQISGLQFVSGAGSIANPTVLVSNETVFSGGTVDLYLKNVVGQNIVVSGGTLNISGNAYASNTTLSGGTLAFQSPKATVSGSLILQGTANTIVVASQQTSGGLGDQAVISGFVTGDVIDDTALASGTTISTTSSTAGGVETVNITSGGTAVETLLFTAGTTALLTKDANNFVELVACYAEGTRILTGTGQVEVERLAVGDRVVTVSGEAKPVRWIGRRCYSGRALAGRHHLLPIRFQAGALADNMPARDLVVSPLHAMLIDDVLVPAWTLVNGSTITRENVDTISYVHIELDHHDVIWAEGAPSETFVDDNGRFIFQSSEGCPVVSTGTAEYYAPRIEQGYLLEKIRARLALRVELLAA